MWISKENYDRDLSIAYEKGKMAGLFDENRSNRAYFLNKETAILHLILPELKELECNTWDKDRVERIRKLLTNSLFGGRKVK